VNADVAQAILRELETLRKLKIFELSQQYSQGKLAEALGVNQSTISRMLPRKKVKDDKAGKAE